MRQVKLQSPWLNLASSTHLPPYDELDAERAGFLDGSEQALSHSMQSRDDRLACGDLTVKAPGMRVVRTPSDSTRASIVSISARLELRDVVSNETKRASRARIGWIGITGGGQGLPRG